MIICCCNDDLYFLSSYEDVRIEQISNFCDNLCWNKSTKPYCDFFQLVLLPVIELQYIFSTYLRIKIDFNNDFESFYCNRTSGLIYFTTKLFIGIIRVSVFTNKEKINSMHVGVLAALSFYRFMNELS